MIKNNQKKKVIFGYILMLLGAMLPLYIFTSISVHNVMGTHEFERFWKEQSLLSEEEKRKLDEEIGYYQKNLSDNTGLVDPFDSETYQTNYEITKEDPNAIFAYLSIPCLNLQKPIRLDASQKHLAMGAAHVNGTGLPIGEENNRSVIAGHRGYFEDLMFLNLGKLKTGDDVFIYRNGESLHYAVSNTEIIKPYEWEKLKPIEGKDILTLLTCEPIAPPRKYRLLVNCERVLEQDVEQKLDREFFLKQNFTDIEQGNDIDLENKNVNDLTLTDTKIIALEYVIYTGTIFFWCVFLWVIFHFFRFLQKRCMSKKTNNRVRVGRKN